MTKIEFSEQLVAYLHKTRTCSLQEAILKWLDKQSEWVIMDPLEDDC